MSRLGADKMLDEVADFDVADVERVKAARSAARAPVKPAAGLELELPQADEPEDEPLRTLTVRLPASLVTHLADFHHSMRRTGKRVSQQAIVAELFALLRDDERVAEYVRRRCLTRRR